MKSVQEKKLILEEKTYDVEEQLLTRQADE